MTTLGTVHRGGERLVEGLDVRDAVLATVGVVGA